MGLLSVPPHERERQEVLHRIRYRLIGSHYEMEQALSEATAHKLADWLRAELATALLDVEGILQRMGSE